jgi:hypothetical protein
MWDPQGAQLKINADGSLQFVPFRDSPDQQQYARLSNKNLIKFNKWNTISITNNGKFYVNGNLAFEINATARVHNFVNDYPIQSISICV